jgi:regulator of protease activity HflC (stomatin/prohibitin superfamily)
MILALLSMGLIVVLALAAAGFFTVNPGEAKVLQLLGVYKGTVRNQGFWYANPFVTKKTTSLRIRNFETTNGMVKHALEMLSSKGIVTLDEERKAQMVSNLLVVLCSERAASPVVNAGSIFG